MISPAWFKFANVFACLIPFIAFRALLKVLRYGQKVYGVLLKDTRTAVASAMKSIDTGIEIFLPCGTEALLVIYDFQIMEFSE